MSSRGYERIDIFTDLGQVGLARSAGNPFLNRTVSSNCAYGPHVVEKVPDVETLTFKAPMVRSASPLPRPRLIRESQNDENFHPKVFVGCVLGVLALFERFPCILCRFAVPSETGHMSSVMKVQR